MVIAFERKWSDSEVASGRKGVAEGWHSAKANRGGCPRISGVQSRKTRASVVRGAGHVGGEHTWGTVAKYRESAFMACGRATADPRTPMPFIRSERPCASH
ncbi:hypothetical protein QLX08_007309 [Tetragonisca angustula]|uniref:Uncharacterized protein n=1 Tax=Tetragonisca angustula TaxID=166442 RepID=A0AAW0ZQN7_9HYME